MNVVDFTMRTMPKNSFIIIRHFTFDLALFCCCFLLLKVIRKEMFIDFVIFFQLDL